MQDVGNVVVDGDRILGGNVDVLGVKGRADEDEGVIVVGIGADGVDDGLGVVLDHVPVRVDGLVVNFVDDVGVIAVVVDHVAKELEGLGLVGFGFVGMEVDDHVDALVDAGLDDRAHAVFVVLGFVDVSAGFFDAHGRAYHAHVPGSHEFLDGLGGIVLLGAVIVIRPKQRHPGQLHGHAQFARLDVRAVHVELTVDVHRPEARRHRRRCVHTTRSRRRRRHPRRRSRRGHW
mmetsp:Transcript_290/g.750  ORF Transcript_290/g.750 Transcript_290/m.750 type:complete len:232 (+) Transcript_290:704-1399(+)